METKLTLVIAVIALFAASVDAGAATVACVPATPIVGQDIVCTCSGADAATADAIWDFGGSAPTSGVSGVRLITYTRAALSTDTAKEVKCTLTPNTISTATPIGTVAALTKPTIACAPAKVAKDKESTCTCTSTNTGAPTKIQFSTDGGTYTDATEGTPKNAIEVKITKDAKVNCKVTYGTGASPVYSAASDDATITFDAGSAGGGGNGSGAPGLPLAAMLFAFIATLFLRV